MRKPRQPVPEPAPAPEPQATIMELTVQELLSAYETDAAVADGQFVNKIIKVTGVVGRVEVNNTLDVYYINLTSPETKQLQNVRCVFDKKYGSELSQLRAGQTVTVQGLYDGSIIDISMRDCELAG